MAFKMTRFLNSNNHISLYFVYFCCIFAFFTYADADKETIPYKKLMSCADANKSYCDKLLVPPCDDYAFPKKFKPKQVGLEDMSSDKKNFLFRSNVPLKKKTGEFAYNDLVSKMQILAQRANATLPATFTLQVFPLFYSFLDKPDVSDGEKCMLTAEKCYFSLNPKLGGATHWPISGTFVSPYDIPDVDKRQQIVQTLLQWDHDMIDDKVNYLHMLIHNGKPDKTTDSIRVTINDDGTKIIKNDQENENVPPSAKIPVVAVFHCRKGANRTGLLSAAYNMRYNKQSLKEVWTRNQKFKQNQEYSIYMMMWYCLYLEIGLKMTSVKCYNILGKSQVEEQRKKLNESYDINFSRKVEEKELTNKLTNEMKEEIRNRKIVKELQEDEVDEDLEELEDARIQKILHRENVKNGEYEKQKSADL